MFDQFGKQNQGPIAAKYGLLLEYFEYLVFNDCMLTVLETTSFAAFSFGQSPVSRQNMVSLT